MIHYLVFYLLALFLIQTDSSKDQSCISNLSISDSNSIPVIDISLLIEKYNNDNLYCSEINEISNKIGNACRNPGLFYIVNHNISDVIHQRLIDLSNFFFELPPETKNKIKMENAGKAWRGYFSVGDEYTSGIPDQKEGIYFGTELQLDDFNNTIEYEESLNKPLHGKNLWPEFEFKDEFKSLVIDYMNKLRIIGKLIMKSIFCSLDLGSQNLESLFSPPTELFRIFNYPPHDPSKFSNMSQGVGEHTDYGYLTILYQEPRIVGLQFKNTSTNQWSSVPPLRNSFVVNIGDALEHSTQGLFKATPHRVLQRTNSTKGRISMPYFFDPNFDSVMKDLTSYFNLELKKELIDIKNNEPKNSRWDGADPSLFHGPYKKYLLKKVSRVFPRLFEEFIENENK